MVSSFKAEFRKLLTVRSTYVMAVLGLLLIGFVSFWIEGYKGLNESAASRLEPGALTEIINHSVGLGAVFISIIAILYMAHEYRYNTILYTLTANVHRTRVLLTKLLTVALFSIVLGAIFAAFATAAYLIGLGLRDAALPAQDIAYLSMAGKLVFYIAGYALLAMLLAIATRSVIAAISIFLIFPTTVEPLLGLLLKDNAKYLPFTALDSTIDAAVMQATLSSREAMLVSGAYLLAGFLVAWVLFTRRDAS